MIYNFLYIDDNPIEDSQSLIEVINSYKFISINHEKPGTWAVTNELINKYIDKIDGLIIDWKLNEFVESVDFNTEAFIQELRSKMSDGSDKINSIPIVLCSANPDFTVKYLQDNSKHDLFDIVLDKQKLNEIDTSKDLAALAEGYSILKKRPQLSELLSLKDPSILDIRFIDILDDKLKSKSINDIVQFLMEHFIEHPGILIGEDLIAVRLGINKLTSKGWADVLIFLREQEILYNGIFSLGWSRYWMPLLNLTWKKLTGKPIRSMSSTDKIEFLISQGFKDLMPLEIQPFCVSNKFWTICASSNVAIDTVDGLLALSDESTYPWEDPYYISPLAAVRGIGGRVAKSDEYRLENFKAIYEKTHVRSRK